MNNRVPVCVALLIASQVFTGAAPAQTVDKATYTAAQATRGAILYAQYCAQCHGPSLEGGESMPPLRGSKFTEKWASQPMTELFEKTRKTMPITAPGSLTQSQYADLLAHTLLINGYAAGSSELVGDASVRAAIPPAPNTEWLQHRSDARSSNYSALDQINRNTIAKLKVAWRWRSDNFGSSIWPNMETTPLMASGVLYATVGASRAVVAIDARSGETLWMYRLDEGARSNAAPRKGPGRGVALSRSNGRDTLFYISPGYQLVALDANTGQAVNGFGSNGIVDLKLANDPKMDIVNTPIGSSSPPIVVGDVVIVGAAFAAGAAPPKKEVAKGDIMGFDVRSGKHLWTFHTIPRDGEPGTETWTDEARHYTGNTTVWAPMSADVERGLVYLPIESPTSDFYGGHRPGNNLYGDSLACLEARTGKLKWFYQLVHHDIWDYDTPTAPLLVDLNVKGKNIAAVAQVTKQGFTYVFDRVTGKPVWPIVERKVPQSDVPGEVTSPTQPFPTLPEPFERQGVTEDSLNNLTPEIFEEAKKIASRNRMGPLYTPPSLVTAINGGTFEAPNSQGGANWQGAVVDPETNFMYVPTTSTISLMGLGSDPQRSNLNYVLTAASRTTGPFGLPLSRPPWGTIVAIDLNTGKKRWTIANGDTPDYVRNHEKLRGMNIPRTGHDDRGALLVTKSLLFAGEGAGMFIATEGGTKFRAHDKQTGDIIWEMDLGSRQSGVPMTYAIGGKQYIVVAVGAPGSAGEFVALSLAE